MMNIESSVDLIYKYCRDNNLKMLSNLDEDFWKVYRDNSEYFDRLFWRSYKSFIAFSLIESEDVEEVVTEWIYDVASFLKANSKRYSELWRLQTVSDVDYSILDNYNVSETHTTESAVKVTDKIGAKTDTEENTYVHGSITITDTNTYNKGARTETDNGSNTYGQDSVTTNNETNIGQQENTDENTVSAMNVSTYSPKDYDTKNIGERQDTSETTEVRASRTDQNTNQHSEAAYIDSENKQQVRGQQSDSESITKNVGAQTNTHDTDNNESKTVTRKGNIGVLTASKLLEEHRELWESFNFYKLIFDEIAEEFLRIIYF